MYFKTWRVLSRYPLPRNMVYGTGGACLFFQYPGGWICAQNLPYKPKSPLFLKYPFQAMFCLVSWATIALRRREPAFTDPDFCYSMSL
jgi:hypothetical protein